MNSWVQSDINTCVYDVGTAPGQEIYDARIKNFFQPWTAWKLIWLSQVMGRFSLGEMITETDIRLFTSIIRFDVVYYPTLHCSLKLIRYRYPILYRWMLQLYWDDSTLTYSAFRKTTFFDQVCLFTGSAQSLRLADLSRLKFCTLRGHPTG
jgi:glutathionyl-hydroquinone reductase